MFSETNFVFLKQDQNKAKYLDLIGSNYSIVMTSNNTKM